jgi:serine/threonine protein phosphatase 1
MSRYIAVGDVHGCELTFRKLIIDNLKIRKSDNLILVGDLIDRGPRIRGLIDLIINMQEKGYNVVSIRGNHEWLLLKSLKSDEMFALWMLNNGMTTLQSFNVNDTAHIPKQYLKFFKKMPYYVELDDFIIVHGGLNFKKKNPLKHKKSMVWTRNSRVTKKDIEKIGGKRLIVGHTPTPLKNILKSDKKNRILLDGGCVYKGRFPDTGYLVAYDITNGEFHYEENIDF